MEGCLVGNYRWTLTERSGLMLGCKFGMDPGWVIQKGVRLEMLNGPRLGGSEGFLVGTRNGEALRGGEGGGGVVGHSGRGYHLVKQTGPGLVNVRIGCWVGSVDIIILRGADTKVVGSYATRGPR